LVITNDHKLIGKYFLTKFVGKNHKLVLLLPLVFLHCRLQLILLLLFLQLWLSSSTLGVKMSQPNSHRLAYHKLS